jgi:sugar-specific transcriptional regulator TrmB
MKSNTLIETLQSIGLSDMQAKVYEALLHQKDYNPELVWKTLFLSKAGFYVILKELEALELVKKTGKNQIAIENPERILGLFQAKKSQFDILSANFNQLLPSIMQNYSKKNTPEIIRLVQGKTQFLNIVNEILAQRPDEFVFFGNAEKALDLMSLEYFDIWKKKRIKMGIKSRDIIINNYYYEKLNPLNEQEIREIKYLSKGFVCDGLYSVAGDTFICWNPILPKVIVINDPIIAQMFKMNFELIWSLL